MLPYTRIHFYREEIMQTVTRVLGLTQEMPTMVALMGDMGVC